MRLRPSVVVAAAAAAVAAPTLALLGPVVTAAAIPPFPAPRGHAALPYCGDPKSSVFPLKSRLHEGPGTYRPGGDWQYWDLGLQNTSSTDCRRVHPVVVLVDRLRRLRKEQIRLEFRDTAQRRWRTAGFETTDRDEHIGVFDGPGFRGFTLGPRRTLTVAVRMRFSADTGEDRVRVMVAFVQRRDDDGDWIGESGGYDIAIRRTGGGGGDPDVLPPGTEPGEEGKELPGKSPDRAEASPASPGGPGGPGGPTADGADPRHTAPEPGEGTRPRFLSPGDRRDVLAGTGKEFPGWAAGTSGTCLAGGAGLLLLARRLAR